MKLILSMTALALFGSSQTFGQTNFIYDQQSATEASSAEGGGLIPSQSPLGQSFTPSLDSVGFIRLWLDDLGPGNSIGSTVAISIHTNSITGPILGTSDSAFMPDGFGAGGGAYQNFIFSSPLSVTPGVTYFFEPVVQSGDGMGVQSDSRYNYLGGTAFINGSARPLADFWFREGVITVPEPSSVCLGLAGAGALGWFLRRRCSTSA